MEDIPGGLEQWHLLITKWKKMKYKYWWNIPTYLTYEWIFVKKINTNILR